MNAPMELHRLPPLPLPLRRHIAGELGPRQLAWLREHISQFADAERGWKQSRGISI